MKYLKYFQHLAILSEKSRQLLTASDYPGKMPLQYSQFCNYFNRYLEVNKATMHFEHKVAEKIEVDWCGTTVPVVNELTGEVTKGYLFVGTLPYSQYSYAELMGDMKQENWINAHVHMFEFFGGTTPNICPDNLKTGLSDILKMEMSYLIRPTRKWVTITMSPSFLLP